MKQKGFISGLTLLFLVLSGSISALPIESKYHSSEETESYLVELALAHPDVVQVESVAKSIEGRDVWMVEVGRDRQWVGLPVSRVTILLVRNSF